MFSILSYLKFAKKIGHFRRFFLGPFFAILTKQRTAAAILLIAWQNEEKCFQKHVSLIFSRMAKLVKTWKNASGWQNWETLGIRMFLATCFLVLPGLYSVPTTEQIVSSAANKRTANRDRTLVDFNLLIYLSWNSGNWRDSRSVSKWPRKANTVTNECVTLFVVAKSPHCWRGLGRRIERRELKKNTCVFRWRICTFFRPVTILLECF